jgi:hypothetical protein
MIEGRCPAAMNSMISSYARSVAMCFLASRSGSGVQQLIGADAPTASTHFILTSLLRIGNRPQTAVTEGIALYPGFHCTRWPTCLVGPAERSSKPRAVTRAQHRAPADRPIQFKWPVGMDVSVEHRQLFERETDSPPESVTRSDDRGPSNRAREAHA